MSVLGRVGRTLVADAPRWGLTPRAALTLGALPVTGLAALALVHEVHRPLHATLTRENGLVEWLQVAAFAAALVASAAVTHRLRKEGRKFWSLLYGLLAVGLVFLLGEELAWGQLLVGFRTPEDFAELNSKGELSLHNISSLEPWFNFAKLLIGAYGTFGLLVLRACERKWESTPLELVIVPAFLIAPFFFTFAVRLLRTAKWIRPGYGEYEELAIAYGFAVFTILVWRRLRTSS
jgi:hypothetical protein